MSGQTTFRQLIGVPSHTSISPSDSVLLIIDAQNEYAEGKLKVKNVDTSRAVIADLLKKYRTAKSDIIHIVHDTPDGAPVFTPGTSLPEIFAELTPQANEEVIHKKFPSSFTGTNLQTSLEKIGKKQIALCGYMAHVCVTGTARSGMEHGYDVVVVKDAVGDRDIPGAKGEELVNIVMTELNDAIATIVENKDVK
ncbi:unnamed protein product [Didymodactylos carnosus]|uniref:Isochorismatase-like domain-containing protein n=1 Tax=Didymodactylos carnosus TaxID=1234261 RepID=A0A814WE11_9BILA|nr:unnamed protein product [Didymodactylos carnosus]CAF1204002.1 unnamed protein product [Didymodactylos carnosus]CAF3968204.1 unnamed protein product [Didymodactylos carnosus]CAF4002991.1 unnamed protein product [Didymodactylos carnosus]